MKNLKINLSYYPILCGFLFSILLTFTSCENAGIDEISKINNYSVNQSGDISFEKNYLVFKSKESFMATLKNIGEKDVEFSLKSLGKKGFSPLYNDYLEILSKYGAESKSNNKNHPFNKDTFNQEILNNYGKSFIIKEGNIFPNTFNFNVQKIVNKNRIVKIGKFMYQFSYDKVKIFESVEKVSTESLDVIQDSNTLIDVQKITHNISNFPQNGLSSSQTHSSARISSNGTIQFNNFIYLGGFFGTNYLDSKIDCQIDRVNLRFPDCDYNPDDSGHGPVGSEYTCYEGYEYRDFVQVMMRHTATSSSLFGGNNTGASCPDGIKSMEIEGNIDARQANNLVYIYTGNGIELIQTIIGDFMITNERKRIFQYHYQNGTLKFTANVLDIYAPNVVAPRDITLSF